MLALWQLLSQKAIASPSTFMPVAGSAVAADVDKLYEFLLIVSGISFVLVIGGLVYFALKYKRKSDNDKTAYISHNNFLEFLWSFIPFVIFIVVFAWGWDVYHDMKTFPEDSLEVHVFGQKWSWEFQYKSGRKENNIFVVPIDTPIKLIMTSRDVIHSFFVPAMRIKQDVVPGRYTALGFKANKLGTFQVFCTEFCGELHSSMLAKLKVVPKKEYEEWISAAPEDITPIKMGQKIFEGKCTVCHNTDSSRKIGPGLKGIFGSQRNFEVGPAQVADENYLRESILNPAVKIVKGYPPAMTPFQGQLSEEELSSLIEYLKSLK